MTTASGGRVAAGLSVCAPAIVAGTAPVICDVRKIVEWPDFNLSLSVRSLRATSWAVLVRSSRSFARHSPTMNSNSMGTPVRRPVSGSGCWLTIS
jgi:hypothetical protein